MEKECEYDGSILMTAVNNCRDPRMHHHLIRSAHRQKPESKFWKDAYDHIKTVYDKFKKREERRSNNPLSNTIETTNTD